VAFRRRNFRPRESLPCTTPGGSRLTTVSLHACLDRLVRGRSPDPMSEDQRRNNGRIGFAGTDISNAAFVLRLMARESWAFANSDLFYGGEASTRAYRRRVMVLQSNS